MLLHHIIEKHAENKPEAPFSEFNSRKMSYKEANAMANKFANACRPNHLAFTPPCFSNFANIKKSTIVNIIKDIKNTTMELKESLLTLGFNVVHIFSLSNRFTIDFIFCFNILTCICIYTCICSDRFLFLLYMYFQPLGHSI